VNYIGRSEFFSFQDQATFSINVTIAAGDRLNTHFLFDQQIQDTQVFQLLYYYPAIPNFFFCGTAKNGTSTMCGSPNTFLAEPNPLQLDPASVMTSTYGQRSSNTCNTKGSTSTTASIFQRIEDHSNAWFTPVIIGTFPSVGILIKLQYFAYCLVQL
jgi:hypothetical protein